jgi:deoxyribonuclease-4
LLFARKIIYDVSVMKKKTWIGAHTSASGGSFNALIEGQKIGATTIQLFTSNQKQWTGRVISEEEIERWNNLRKETDIDQIMSHDSYLINLGSPNPELLEKSKQAFIAEIRRCHLLDITYLNFHPGAATTGTEQECLDTIARSLIEIAPVVKEGSTILLLEATAGQGTSVGHKFEHLAYIIEKVSPHFPLGVCIDTCHIFAAGYDIRNASSWDKTLKEFDRIVGLEHLKAFHINDSQKDLGSKVDRHASLGKGKIGMASFEEIEKLKNL